MSSQKNLYRIAFVSHNQIYEIYATSISQGDLFGFVCVEGLTFGTTSSVVLDPSEEKLKAEFEGVERTFIPLHSILRVDSVKKQGTAKISPVSTKDSHNTIPFNIYQKNNSKNNDKS